jgi:hypothetical protein
VRGTIAPRADAPAAQTSKLGSKANLTPSTNLANPRRD